MKKRILSAVLVFSMILSSVVFAANPAVNPGYLQSKSGGQSYTMRQLLGGIETPMDVFDIVGANEDGYLVTIGDKQYDLSAVNAAFAEVDYDTAEDAVREAGLEGTPIVEENFDTISQMTMSKVYESSQFFTKDYVKMEITDNGAIEIQGRTDLDKTDWMFIVEKDNQIDVIKESHTVRSDHTYGHTFALKNKLKEGKYKVGVYFKEKHDKVYWGYYWNIPLNYEDGEIFFPVSPVYTNNYLAVIRGSVSNPESYLEMSTTNASEKKDIIDLANTITKDARSDYDKLLKVNDWVAQNIYYNWDGYLKKSYGRTDAYGTLISKKSVCQGYAELTQELLRAAGIPARLVTGHALGVSASGRGWDGVNHEKSNHAWNEAFVDGRWIILDTTWNSGNKYENGGFKKGSMNYKYFDIDLKAFSFSHKILAL